MIHHLLELRDITSRVRCSRTPFMTTAAVRLWAHVYRWMLLLQVSQRSCNLCLAPTPRYFRCWFRPTSIPVATTGKRSSPGWVSVARTPALKMQALESMVERRLLCLLSWTW